MATFTVSVVMVCGGQFFFFQEGTVEKALFRNRLFIIRQFFRDCLEGVFFFCDLTGSVAKPLLQVLHRGRRVDTTTSHTN